MILAALRPHLLRASRTSALVGAAIAVVSLGCEPRSSTTGGMVVQSPERQSETQYDLALDSFSKGDPRRALDYIEKALKLNEDNTKALYLASGIYLSFCASDLGLTSPDCHLDRAETFCRRAVKLDDSFRDARNALGQILILEKKYAEAITILTPLTKDAAYSQPHLAWGNLGWAQVMSGDIDGGITSLRNAVTTPNFCVGQYRLGVAYQKKGNLALAEDSLSRAIDVENSDCKNMQDAWEARGSVRMKLGKAAEARADFEKCLAISATSEVGKICSKEIALLGGRSSRDSFAMPASQTAETLSLAEGVGALASQAIGGHP